jgi:hypothetical protein
MASKFKACSVAIFVVVIDVAVVILVAVTVIVDEEVNGLTSKLKRITHGTIKLSLLHSHGTKRARILRCKDIDVKYNFYIKTLNLYRGCGCCHI